MENALSVGRSTVVGSQLEAECCDVHPRFAEVLQLADGKSMYVDSLSCMH